jgi:alpha-tubulin suppressor-like RCC1 family protein
MTTAWPKLCAIVLIALGLRLWMLHSYLPVSPWVAAITLADAEMGRNLLAGRGWVANVELIEEATRAQIGRRTMVDLADLPPVDDAKPGALVELGEAHSPGYSAWFALSYWLGGEARYKYSQRMQATLDALACVLLFTIGRAIWSSSVGLVAAGIYALWPAPAFLANLTVAASTDSFWFIMVACGAVTVWKRIVAGASSWPGVLIVGAAAFGGACMNSTAFVLPAAVAGVALLAVFLDRRAGRLAIAMVAAQLLVIALLLPWGLRNQRLYGQFSFVRGSFWQLAWASFGELPNPWGLGFDDKNYLNWLEENCADCNSGERERFTRDYILSQVVSSWAFPRHVANLTFVRLPRLVEVARLPEGVYDSGASAASRRSLSMTLGTIDALVPSLFICAGIGVVVAWLRPAARMPALIAMAPTLFLTMFSLLFYVELRKTVPGYGFLSVLAAIALVEGWARAATVVRTLGNPVAKRRIPPVLVFAVVFVNAVSPGRAAVISAGELHSVATSASGSVSSWGADLYGQLGDGAVRTRYAAIGVGQVLGLQNIVAVAAGGNHSLALKADGTVWAWGDNLWGELGDGSRRTRARPVRVEGVDRVVAICAGYLHSVALRSDGTVWTWGNDVHGQLGDGAYTDRLAPVQVQGVEAVAIAAGFFHTIAIDRRGGVWTWGQNTQGQLGYGATDRPLPGRVPGIANAKMAAGGQYHTLALLQNGTVWSWGGNTFGQLGYATASRDSTTAPRNAHIFEALDMMRRKNGPSAEKTPVGVGPADHFRPREIPGVSLVQQIAAGEDYSLALTHDHTVLAWGDNLYGQLGNGTWDNQWSPVRVNVPGEVTEIAAGYSHAIALRPDGSLWTWGFGHYGQLGLGPVERRVSRPTRVAAMTLAPEPTYGRDFQRFGSPQMQWASNLARWDAGRLLIKGTAAQPFLYACLFQPLKAGPGERARTFVAQGELRAGGVTVGLQVQEKWVFQKNIDEPGPFLIRWEPPAADAYRVVIAHYLPRKDRETDVEITHLGWTVVDPTSAGSTGRSGAR